MNARTVTIRAKTRHSYGETRCLVFESGRIMVEQFHPKTGTCFIDPLIAGLTDAARRRAWQASGFKRGGR